MSYVVSVCSLLLIRVPFQEKRVVAVRNLHVEIVEGLRWLWHQPLLRTMALLTGGDVFCGAGFTLIVIVIAQQQHASAATIGLIFDIGGIGGILGALMAGPVQRCFGFAQVVVGVLWMYVVFWLALVALPAPLVIGLITAVLFFIGPFYNVAYVSRRLAITPDGLQSRVNSVARLIGLGFSPLGLALTGALLQYGCPQMTILLSVCGQVFLALVVTVSTSIRNARPLTEGQRQERE